MKLRFPLSGCGEVARALHSRGGPPLADNPLEAAIMHGNVVVSINGGRNPNIDPKILQSLLWEPPKRYT